MSVDIRSAEGNVVSCKVPLLDLCSWFGDQFSGRRESLTFKWFSWAVCKPSKMYLDLKKTAIVQSMDGVPWSMHFVAHYFERVRHACLSFCIGFL
jgi:hypothetical protein